MEASLSTPFADAPGATAARVASVPWHCYAVVFGATSIVIGILWDISWHSTIGRDTFWTPAHLAIYLGGLLGGLCSGWLVFKTTFLGSPAERAAAVRLWGALGPIGAWVSIWGAAAMLTSAPFDDWWHNTYGLDVKILSPPHAVLAAGMHHIVVGTLLLVLSLQNRASGDGQRTGRWLFIYASGVMIALASVLVTEYSLPNSQHNGMFYKVSACLYPLVLIPVARASKLRWPATTAAAIYMLLVAGMLWVLPLFPATPRLAPIYNPVTHMVPPAFPVLLIVPGILIDLLFRWIGRGRGWRRDLLLILSLTTAFVVSFVPTQWHFSKLLISPLGDNWFLGGQSIWNFASRPGSYRSEFWDATTDPVTAQVILIVWVIALVTTSIGLASGNYMARVKR